MNIVSLFDGMACGMLAMTGAGVTVDVITHLIKSCLKGEKIN